GTARAVFQGLPVPDAIFGGGAGKEVSWLLEGAFTALRPGGAMVLNVSTLESLSTAYATMKALAGPVEAMMVNVARGNEQLESLRFEAVNPTFLIRIRKPERR